MKKLKKSENIFLILIIFFILFLPTLFYLNSELDKKLNEKKTILKQKNILLDEEFIQIKKIVCNYSLKERRTIKCD